MPRVTRKDFLHFSSALLASTGLTACATTTPDQQTAIPQAPASNGATLIRGADVLTMNSGFEELQNTDVLVVGGQITQMGRGLVAPGAEVIEAKGMILMPGMSDGHRHVWQSIELGRLVKTHPAQYSTYQDWKMRTVVSMNADEFYLANLLGGLLAIDSGVTSILDYAHGQINEETAIASALGLRDSGIAGWYAFQLGVSMSYRPGEAVDRRRAESERVSAVAETHWATVEALQKQVFTDPDHILQLGICPSSGIGDRLEDIAEEWGRARATGVKMLAAHGGGPRDGLPEGYMGHRNLGMRDLYEAGLLGPDYHVSHGNRLSADELGLLRETGGMVCSTAMGEFPYMARADRGPSCHGRAREAGVAVGIGIDVPLALPIDYFEHTRAAFWNLYLDPTGVRIASEYQSADVLDFATALGAKALRLGDVTGSIEVGKRADLVLLRTNRPGFARLGTLADRVAMFAAREDIDSVWVAGSAKKRHGKLVGVDMGEIMDRVEAAQRRYGPLADSITFID